MEDCPLVMNYKFSFITELAIFNDHLMYLLFIIILQCFMRHVAVKRTN